MQEADRMEGIPIVRLRPVTDDDIPFLVQVYASTRADEHAVMGWRNEQWEEFIQMQFELQHRQYRQNHRSASFDIILVDEMPAGRIYVDREENQFRLVDISILPESRGQGIGTRIIQSLLAEASAERLPVTLHVVKFNPAVQLYLRLGFKIREDRGVFWFMAYGEGERMISKTRLFNNTPRLTTASSANKFIESVYES